MPMNHLRIPFTELLVSPLAYGCMHIGGSWDSQPATALQQEHAASAFDLALGLGINFFDHADIYTLGKSEQLFGQWLAGRSSLREQLVIQSKCGIRFADDPYPGAVKRYDFSYEHIIAAAEASLRRLRTDYLDLFLLHRPDALMEPEEVARAFDQLHASGKVRYFGASNHSGSQLALLRHHLRQPLVVNQLQLSLSHSQLLEEGVMVNRSDGQYAATAGTLDYCRLNGIQLQAWSPLGGGALCRQDQDVPPSQQRAARRVAELADFHATTPEAVVLAWLLRHPAAIQPVVGTTNLQRLRACARATELQLSREEWYSLWVAARGHELP